MKRKILTAILAGSMLFAAAGCGQQENSDSQPVLVQEEEEAAYPTTTAEYGEVVKNVTVRCAYTSTEKQDLSFPVDGGLIARVEVKMGDYVDPGQLLVALDVEDLEETIEELTYQIQYQELKIAQTEEMKAFELASAERLYTYTYMTKQDKEDLAEKKESINKQYQTTLEDMNDQLTTLQKRLEQYRRELEDGQLFADITGEITYLENSLKDTYSKKDRVVVTVSNLDACYFITDDLEYADYFKEADSLTVNYRESGTEYTCEAVPALTDSWEEQMYFKPVGDEIIASKTNGTITMEMERKDNVLCVPEDAIHESDNGPFVYLEKDGLLEMRYVTVGLEGDTMVEITDGLEQGEIVALKK